MTGGEKSVANAEFFLSLRLALRRATSLIRGRLWYLAALQQPDILKLTHLWYAGRIFLPVLQLFQKIGLTSEKLVILDFGGA